MARRQASRVTFALLAAASVVAVGVLVFKNNGSDRGTDKLLPHEEGPTLASAKIDSAGGSPTLVKADGPSISVTPSGPMQGSTGSSGGLPGSSDTSKPVSNDTRPHNAGEIPTENLARQPRSGTSAAVTPVGFDADLVFKQAASKRDNGDLVTARDLMSSALGSGKLDGSDADAARTFIGQLNEKIILGTQKFPADPYNKTWNVESGQVLEKIAKRFDVTANLLCRINGLSSPTRLRADSTIKTIQGPFHVVVSKSRFQADVYLGAPGGEGSMYVKTFRVGLGSDNSTPTGTWQVDSGKLVNPVYYSPRGEGVIAGDDPKNPLGERWIPLKGIEGECLGKESYGIHGTIDPDSIGKNMSMGCIRLINEDVEYVYDLLVEGKSMVKVVD